MVMARTSAYHGSAFCFLFCCFLGLCCLPSITRAYKPGDIVPMSKAGQYHASRTSWYDVIGRHCPIFAVNREVLIPIPKPTGFTGADPYKISFQVGHEKFHVPWLYVINRKSSEVPLIDFHLRYSGSDLHGVTAKVIDMPHHCPYYLKGIGKIEYLLGRRPKQGDLDFDAWDEEDSMIMSSYEVQ
ncbi:hypothetical protein ZIOFF_029917 [Zingiber officinale]|uniref:Uncharacterized protein n=1 Tax=Zingiber officinale TaxID=94328 RepID=A0A8J5GZ86_ZINOF|nr:hypothetical protein ZIOFF_029917 [Zingiber officinale]